MASIAFNGWIDLRSEKAAQQNGVFINDIFVSWAEIDRQAIVIAETLLPYSTYIVDPSYGHDSFVALLAVARTPGARLLWAPRQDIAFATRNVATAIFCIEPDPMARSHGDRPLYGSLTSGSGGDAKLPLGYADQMAVSGLHYDKVMYELNLGEPLLGGTIATCLPTAYSATFMMAIMPAWFAARNLMITKPDRWDQIYKRLSATGITALTVPAMLPLACTAAGKNQSGQHLTIITTAGYLTSSRIRSVYQSIPDARLMSSYGASETGVMTLDVDPVGDLHVGKPIYGKPVWISSMNDENVGKVTTTGPDVREYYIDRSPIRNSDGTVAITDLGHFDDNGNLFLDGRLDAGEKIRGITIYPKRIERHLLEMTGVEDAKVQIISGAGLGPDQLIATVVGDLDEQMVGEHCETLPDFLRPSKIIVKQIETAYSERGKL